MRRDFMVLTGKLQPVWAHEISAEPNDDTHRPASIDSVTEEGFTVELPDARDAGGKFYLVDRRTASIHVFAASGAFSHRCDPSPGDFDDHVSSTHLSVAGDGTVYLSRGLESGYIIFDAEGRRIERRATRIHEFAEDWYAHPTGLDRWVTTMDELYLTEADGDVLYRIRSNRTSATIARSGTTSSRTTAGSYNCWIVLAVSSIATTCRRSGDRATHVKLRSTVLASRHAACRSRRLENTSSTNAPSEAVARISQVG